MSDIDVIRHTRSAPNKSDLRRFEDLLHELAYFTGVKEPHYPGTTPPALRGCPDTAKILEIYEVLGAPPLPA
jgi:hypothetical protein